MARDARRDEAWPALTIWILVFLAMGAAVLRRSVRPPGSYLPAASRADDAGRSPS